MPLMEISLMNMNDIIEQLSKDSLGVLTLPIFLAAILFEVAVARRENLVRYKVKDTATSVSMLVLSGIVEVVPKALAFVAFFYLHEISPLKNVVERQWWAWLCLFLLDDFFYYWFHRANHEVRVLWAGHVPHHSSVYLNFGTALRQGVGERLHKFLFWMWLPLLGFDALMIFIMISVNLTYQFWVHTELVDKLPAPVEFLFNTPSHHRVHHASNIRYLDCNHAGVLIIWDRLFGTFSAENSSERPVYGLTKNINTYNPLRVATKEYGAIWKDVKRADKWSDKLRYLLLAPGWCHDGTDKRARVLRKELV